MRIFTWILAMCVLLVAGYCIWGYTGKDYSSLYITTVSINITSDSADKGKGNLLGIQPFMTASDYCDQQHFHDALVVYFTKAKAAGLLRSNTIVVLPENIGSWLAFAGEKTRVYQSDSMRLAVSTIVNSNIFTFISNLLVTPAGDKIKHAFIYMKASSMARIYAAVFSSLAKEFKVTISAGSILLPQPSLDAKGRILIKKGQLYYSAFMFNPEGKIQAGPLLQALPEYNSGENTGAADSNMYSITQTPAGNVVMAADKEANMLSSGPREKKTGIKAGILFTGTDRIWNAVWRGAGGFTIPLSAVKNSADTSSQGAPRIDYTLPAKMPAAGIHTGMNNRFSGKLWEIRFTDKLLAMQHDSLSVNDPARQQGSIINVWIR